MDLYEKWNWETEEYLPLGYRTIHNLKVTSYGVENVGELLDELVEAGATIDYVSFQLSDGAREELETELISEAVLDAQSTAQQIAKAAGVELGKLLSASYGTPSYYTKSFYAAELDGAMNSEEGAETSLSPGEIEVSVSVSTVFGLN